MRWTGVRGIACLAVVAVAASTVFAADEFYLTSAAELGVGEISVQPSGSLSNAGIDRLLEVNATQDSLLQYESSHPGRSQDDVSARHTGEIAPLADVIDTSTGSPRGIYVLGGCCAAFALGLGLCCAGMMSGKQRTLNTFTAGFVNMKK